MAKKKPAKPKNSSPRKKGIAKPKRKALDDDTSEEELQAAIERQREALEASYGEHPYSEEFGEIETLLDVPNRKPLEDPGNSIHSSNGLVRFVIDKPSLYKKFVAQMREGASLASAAFSSRFANPPLIKKWLNQGMEDSEAGLDTFFSRLFYDVAGANAERRAEIEIIVAETEPLKWLQQGPGKYLDDEWKPKVAPRALPNGAVEAPALEEESPLKITAKVEVEDELEGEIVKAPVEPSQYQKALEVLRQSGNSPEQQPEGWMHALRIQTGEQLSEEELEVDESDDESPISLGSNEAILTEQERQAQSSYPH